MTKLFFLVALLLASCQQPTQTKVDTAQPTTPTAPIVPSAPSAPSVPEKPLHIYYAVDSFWNIKKTQPVYASSARDVLTIAPAEIQDFVTTFNVSNTDSFLRIFEDIVPPIDQSPNVTVYGVYPVTYKQAWIAENIPRQLLIDNLAGWKASSYNLVMFIDHVPPPPVVSPIANPYEYWSIYVMMPDGVTPEYEDHCGYLPDETWDAAGISDYKDVETYYYFRSQALRAQAQQEGHQFFADRQRHPLPAIPGPPN